MNEKNQDNQEIRSNNQSKNLNYQSSRPSTKTFKLNRRRDGNKRLMFVALFIIFILVSVLALFILYKANILPKSWTNFLNKTQQKTEETKDKLTNQQSSENTTKSRVVNSYLFQLNNSNQTGVVKLSEKDGKLEITGSYGGVKQDESVSLFVVKGTCLDPKEVLYEVGKIENLKSNTIINTDLEKLKTDSPVIIMATKNGSDEFGQATICGPIDFEGI